jgi:hypothetical protein
VNTMRLFDCSLCKGLVKAPRQDIVLSEETVAFRDWPRWLCGTQWLCGFEDGL